MPSRSYRLPENCSTIYLHIWDPFVNTLMNSKVLFRGDTFTWIRPWLAEDVHRMHAIRLKRPMERASKPFSSTLWGAGRINPVRLRSFLLGSHVRFSQPLISLNRDVDPDDNINPVFSACAVASVSSYIKGGNNAYVIGLLWRWYELILLKKLTWFLIHGVCAIKVRYQGEKEVMEEKNKVVRSL